MNTVASMEAHACQVCKNFTLQLVGGFEMLPRVTSDCRPFGRGGKLTVCMCCGAVQKIPDSTWLAEIGQIYPDYQAYRLADGEEQLVVDPLSGKPKKRSLVIMEQLRNGYRLPEYANVIDIGCGDGVTLQAMSEYFPKWQLNGHELGSGKLNKLKQLRGFNNLYCCNLADIDEKFDVVTMIHSLEHFVEPLETLKNIRRLMADNGILFIEVCNIDENPFDLLVADHLMHFSPYSLSNMARQAGFKCMTVKTDWVKKELSFVAIADNGIFPLAEVDAQLVYKKIKSHVEWLSALINDAVEKSSNFESFGVFGTSIAASWLKAALGDRVQFFVDEDPNRVGREYMGRPVYSPCDVPEKSNVYLALAPSLADSISQRLRSSAWAFVGAPVL